MPDNFNTVEFMDTLVEGGFPEKQAKALAAAMFQLIDSHLVTKSYLDMRLSEVRAEFRADMAEMKFGLIQWMVGIMIVQTGATAVLLKLIN
ncbi:MAG TPA: DUF1640 domain-containing protein [Duganella sp.]|jgi:hypothetical protein